jgi:hypothetical protein
MCLAVQYQRFSVDEERRLQIVQSNPELLIRTYLEKTIQCLILGNYSKAPPYSVETLMLYIFIEALRGQHIRNLDRPWIQWGNIVRIALKAGYHRDGSHFKEMSCFQAELRRRVWAILVGWDLYLSTQLALPRMVHIAACDTANPRNLYDEDLYEHMIELPPSRSNTAKSCSQFHVAKNQLLEIFSKITEVMTSTTSGPKYFEVLKLDRMLNEAYETIMPDWQPSPGVTGPDCAGQAPASVSVLCTFLTFIYHKAQMVLHRRYISIGRKNRQYAYSRRVAVEAALTTLQHQWVLYLETQVGGQLCRHGWKFLVLLVQDFLFATALLCAELAEEIQLATANAMNEVSADKDTDDLRDRIFQALSSSYIVWLQSNDVEASREVKVVVASLKLLLRKASEAGFGQTKMIAPTPPAVLGDTTASNTGASNNTPADSQTLPSQSTVQTPQTGQVYWGLGHFPL